MCERINFAGGCAREHGHFLINFIFDLKLNIFFTLDLDMVVRDENGNVVNINQTSTTQLYEHHVQAANRIRRATVSDYLLQVVKLISDHRFIFTV